MLAGIRRHRRLYDECRTQHTFGTFSMVSGLRYGPEGAVWVAIKSRTLTGNYFGLSHPFTAGRISSTGCDVLSDQVFAPNNRNALRADLLTTSVVTVKDALTASYANVLTTFIANGNTLPSVWYFYGFLERDGATALDFTQMKDWVAARSGLTFCPPQKAGVENRSG